MGQAPEVPQNSPKFICEAATLTDEQYESMVAFYRAGMGRAYGFRLSSDSIETQDADSRT